MRQAISQFDIDSLWIGLDLYNDAQNVRPGYFTQADNVWFDGSIPASRPGFKGLLSSAQVAALGGPIYVLLEFVNSPGTASTILCTAGGKLYKYTLGGTTLTEIKDKSGASLSLNSATAYAKRAGNFAYIVDGVGAMYQTDLTNSNTTSVVGLYAPSSAPAGTLTNTTLDTFSDNGGWVPDLQWDGTHSGANAQINRITSAMSTFGAGGTLPLGNGTQVGNGWTNYSKDNQDGPSNVTSPGIRSGVWAFLDDWEGFGPTTDLTNDTFVGDSSRHPKIFHLEFEWYSLDTTSTNGFEIYVYAKDNSGTVLDSRYVKFVPTFAGQQSGQRYVFDADFTNLPSEIYKWNWTLGGIQGNAHSSASVYATNIVCYPLAPAMAVSGSGGTSHDLAITVPTYSPASTQGLVKGLTITRDYTAGSLQNWYGYNKIALGLGKNYLSLNNVYGLPNTLGLSFHLEFQQNGSSTWYATNSATVTANGYAYIDISTIDPAVRKSFRKVRLVFETNWVTSAILTPVFSFGPITGSGNLSVNSPSSAAGDYFWAWTEVDATGDPSNIVNGVQTGLVNVVESDPSPLTVNITPTGLLAEGKITAATQVNDGSTGKNLSNYYFFYRWGGTFQDGIGRLVCKVPIGSDVTYGADVSNPYYSWDHTNRILIDNTPDSALFEPTTQIGVPIITGRGVPPTGAQAIEVWQNRLALAKGSNIYLSWLLPSGTNPAVYFNTINDPSDPSGAIKGGLFPAGGNDNDNIQSLVALPGLLLAEKQLVVYAMTGADPTTFTLQSFLKDGGVGNIAPRASCIVGGRAWFLGPNGINEFDGDAVVSKSLQLQKALNPAQIGNPAVSTSAYKGSAMIYQGLRLYLACPSGSQTANKTIYVYDTRGRGIEQAQGGWVRWLPPSWCNGVTSFVALNAGTNTDDLYLGSVEGQLYQVTGTVDIQDATTNNTPIAISCALAGRGMGQEVGGTSLIIEKRSSWWVGIVVTGEATNITYGVQRPDGMTFAQAYGVQSGRTVVRKDLPNVMRGDFLIATLSWTTSTRTKVYALGVAATNGTLGR